MTQSISFSPSRKILKSTKVGEPSVYLKCLKCEKSFDAKRTPSSCPYCSSTLGFCKITVKGPDGKKLSYEAIRSGSGVKSK